MGLFENAAIDVLMHGLLNEFDGPLYFALRDAGYQSSTVRWRRDEARFWRRCSRTTPINVHRASSPRI